MKKLLIISCATFLMVCFVSVTFADVGVEKVSKKENTFIVDGYVFASASAYLNDDAGSLFTSFAIVENIDTALKPETSYICKKKEYYVSKKVDRKWVWWYSIVSNT